MAKPQRLSKIARELNLGISTIVEFLGTKGVEVESNPNAKIDGDTYEILAKEFQLDKSAKAKSDALSQKKVEVKETITIEDADRKPMKKVEEQEVIIIKNLENTVAEGQNEEKAEEVKEEPKADEKLPTRQPGEVRVLGTIDLETVDSKKPKKKAEVQQKPKTEDPVNEESKITEDIDKSAEPEHISTKINNLGGPTVVGKIKLPVTKPKQKKPVASSSDKADSDKKRKRKRLNTGAVDKKDFSKSRGVKPSASKGRGRQQKEELTPEQIQAQVKETLARLSGGGGGKNKGAKHRKAKREAAGYQAEADAIQEQIDKGTLKVTEFVTASELAVMMDVQVNDIIAACMSLGMFVSINQRLDAETLTIVAEEFGFKVEFISTEVQEQILEVEDEESSLIDRAPIVTIMGHVDHGKTSLLDYIRKENVIAGEAGGITQHIGAYSVTLENGKRIAFLDTPGHEAFTAMRARGAQVTDVVVVVVAADDAVMPQTKEAINHSQAAGVPIVIAINKIDKEGANPDKVREELSQMNVLVEDWGGKFQCQEISAKQGLNINELLEKVLLEAELLELKANPEKKAVGTIIESSLDKGRGYVTTVLVQAGTMRVGDVIVAGCYSGKVRALQDERSNNIKEAGPATPVTILGLNGAPNAGDKFNVLDDEKEAKRIADKRMTLQREQGIRTQKHVTLDEIGRRLAIGDFKELNIIVKGDVDGSVEALSDTLIKLSTEKIQVNVIHKSVGQISESDVLLATASDAIIVGFQVRPSGTARKLAEKEEIDIRLYSIIYDAVDEVKSAMEGMLEDKIEEKIVCNIEIRETFKISKVGTIAGCYVLDGKITRNTKVRIIRDGIVTYTGNLGSLKRFKDDVKEVTMGYECGLNIDKFNDIKVGDIVEGYEEVAVKQKLGN
ncbi:MAG: translation initiation factor IF-2 [Flavobacteriales bacterium]|jgi:translation initiation factor IF-2|nr:translation initiation factor IF-2 [Flavobacteriales bacterium]